MGVVGVILSAAATALLALAAVIVIDFLRLPRSRHLPWKRAVLLYLLRRGGRLVGYLKWRQFVKESKNLLQTQEQFVLNQIRANASSDYGRAHNFSSITSLEEFRRTQPITTYSDYEDYISRVERGDYGAMFGDRQPPAMFGCSSGTTGRAKLIPISTRGLDFTAMVAGFYGSEQRDLLPISLGRSLSTFCAPRYRFTDSGIKIGSVMATAMQSPTATLLGTLPPEAMTIGDQEASKYVGLLFGLRDPNVERLDGSFASNMFTLLKFLEDHWQSLVRDLRRGRLDEKVNVTPEVREKLNELLQPEPERAAQLEVEFSKGFDNIMMRIFPKMSLVASNSSGSSMAVYKERCRPYLGDLTIHSPIYICTEGLLGMNIRHGRDRPGYVLVPSEAYLEFLPVDDQGVAAEGAQPVQANEVEVGKMYEIIITNVSGFYRYRLGDIVEVVGFFNQIPLVDFMFRNGQMLNVNFEKLSEQSFTSSLESAVHCWGGIKLLDFTTAESVLSREGADGQPPHYLVFLETEGGIPTEKQKNMIDEKLCEQNYVYKSFRVKNAIGPMKVMSVIPGTFSKYRDQLISGSSTFLLQFKQPRVLRSEKQVQFFMEHRLEEKKQ
ncbi:jasmonoyl--L-amino acid synthetase JAR4-like [Amphibalanus amphitrite]|uniref:jasmonoyl--L-amino acid synthetase JAR4-like n=1 Tax=Amphibalanus amphitrite TaxID=1232801 RepID=UPI001C91CEDD|nr:jasmonoyl--L-amino acid synthetase JAR4-like [Amphibalanus amphitrite]